MITANPLRGDETLNLTLAREGRGTNGGYFRTVIPG